MVEIATIEDLIAFSKRNDRGTSTNFLDVIVTNDLDFHDLPETDPNRDNWAGCTGTWYINFDGQNHTISNISYNGTSEWGFFYNAANSNIKNLILKDVDLFSSSRIGVVSCRPNGAHFTNVRVSGQASSAETIGVFADTNNTCYVDKCSFSGNLIGNNYNYGLAYGYISGGYICNSYITGTLEGKNITAIGRSKEISRCFFVGNVSFSNSLKFSSGRARYCYASVSNANEFSDYVNADNVFDTSSKYCWFDNTVWKNGETVDGNGVGVFGTPFLKNAEWLRQQGWDI